MSPKKDPAAVAGDRVEDAHRAGDDISASIAPGGDKDVNLEPDDRRMTKADRGDLERIARKRARLAKSQIGERVKVLRADVEDQLSAEHKFDDATWADITQQASIQVAAADAQIAEICRRNGVPEDLRPSLSLSWHGRGENALASRRSELRKLAQARIDAAAETAKVTIETSLLEVETKLIRDGLASSEAVAFLQAMPTPEQLLLPVDVTELAPLEGQRWDGADDYRARVGGWHPPTDTASQLLTPSTMNNREEKRRTIAAALAEHPEHSDRQIARLAGADHKTVGKLRTKAGDFPTEAGEIPTEDGEIPTFANDLNGAAR